MKEYLTNAQRVSYINIYNIVLEWVINC